MTTTKDELKRMATETAYSSKGHFKTADWMNFSLAAYIGVPIITSLIAALFVLPETALRILSFLGLLFAFLALASVLPNNRDKAGRMIAAHMDLGNKYLAIHKEIRVRMADLNSITTETLASFQQRISDLDQQTSRCKIGLVGRWWAKARIYPEMDLHWIDSA